MPMALASVVTNVGRLGSNIRKIGAEATSLLRVSKESCSGGPQVNGALPVRLVNGFAFVAKSLKNLR